MSASCFGDRQVHVQERIRLNYDLPRPKLMTNVLFAAASVSCCLLLLVVSREDTFLSSVIAGPCFVMEAKFVLSMLVAS